MLHDFWTNCVEVGVGAEKLSHRQTFNIDILTCVESSFAEASEALFVLTERSFDSNSERKTANP
jgi:hypothetical protein